MRLSSPARSCDLRAIQQRSRRRRTGEHSASRRADATPQSATRLHTPRDGNSPSGPGQRLMAAMPFAVVGGLLVAATTAAVVPPATTRPAIVHTHQRPYQGVGFSRSVKLRTLSPLGET